MVKRRASRERNLCKRSDGRREVRCAADRDLAAGSAVYKNVLALKKERKKKLKRAIEENAKADTIRAEQYAVGQ